MATYSHLTDSLIIYNSADTSANVVLSTSDLSTTRTGTRIDGGYIEFSSATTFNSQVKLGALRAVSSASISPDVDIYTFTSTGTLNIGSPSSNTGRVIYAKGLGGKLTINGTSIYRTNSTSSTSSMSTDCGVVLWSDGARWFAAEGNY